MSDIIILQGTTPVALVAMIAERLKSEIAASQGERFLGEGEVLFTRHEATKFLSVNLSTLHLWTKQGRIPVYKIANRVYFKKSELIGALRPVTLASR